jgi:benzil reductase ((S)-benzoin forming)
VPFTLCGRTLARVRERPPRRTTIVNISSGVSTKSADGWSVYCASKAALNRLTESIAIETAGWPAAVRSVAVNPGPLDTEMQRLIRCAPDGRSGMTEPFRAMHEAGQLIPPAIAARKVLDLIDLEPFPNGSLVDLRSR